MAKHKLKAEPTRTRQRTYSDPLSAALQPPENESPAEREKRLEAEREAKLINDEIDEQIRQDRYEMKRQRGSEVKVLLLGQSESGKSTTLKQFQLLHSPAAFHVERIAWRPVIYLNLVRSIRRILDSCAPEADLIEEPDELDNGETASIIISSAGRPPSAISGTRIPQYESHKRHLQPLIDLEDLLIRLLSEPDQDEAVRVGPLPLGWGGSADPNQDDDSRYNDEDGAPTGNIGGGWSTGRPATLTLLIPPSNAPPRHTSPISANSLHHRGLPSPSSPNGTGTPSSNSSSHSLRKPEVSIPATTNWKKNFQLGGKPQSPKSAHTGEIQGWWEDPEDPVHALHALAPAMLELWKDPNVRQRLKEKRLRLEESSGFYLNEIPRITAKKYIPTDEDVLKARLKTMGVVEHAFKLTKGSQRGVEWKIYDVGGSRNQRQAWAPYFEDVNAIIFLAPISAFDQVLAEDTRVNRLEDTLLLWKSLVSNKLLSNVNIVLFLNKCDLLQTKLEAGVKLSHHMVSYGDRPNDYNSVSNYFRNKFGALHQSYTPNRDRELFIHLTAVTDTRRTATIITTVRDSVIKTNLKNFSLV